MKYCKQIHDDERTHYNWPHVFIDQTTKFLERKISFPLAYRNSQDSAQHGCMHKNLKENMIGYERKFLKPEKKTCEKKERQGEN